MTLGNLRFSLVARRAAVAALGVGFALFGTYACHAGGLCIDGAEACVEGTTGLVCQDGRWVDVGCQGCTLDSCDIHRTPAGAPCSPTLSRDAQCDAADDTLVSCRPGPAGSPLGVVVRQKCPGLRGCREEGVFGARCDRWRAEAGDACQHDACSLDGRTLLACHDGALVAAQTCRAPRGCVERTEGSGAAPAFFLECDAEVGDACQSPTTTCSPDTKQMLKCRDGKMALEVTCRGPKGCWRDAGKVTCDRSLREVGDGCEDEGKGWCSVDGKSVVVCHDAKVVEARACPEGCERGETKVFCKGRGTKAPP